MKIRLIKKDEAQAAAKIIGRAFSGKGYQAKAQKEIEAMFLNHAVRPQYLVAEERQQILGLAGFSQSWMDYDIYEIFWVAVDPAYQRRGVGRALVDAVVKIIKKKKGASLILLTTTHPNFYKKFLKFKVFTQLAKNEGCLMRLKIN